MRNLLGLEERTGAACVMVLEETEDGEQFGLRVDGMVGVVTVDQRSLEANPSTLDARSALLFDGAYTVEAGLVVQLALGRLQPSRLGLSGLFQKSQTDPTRNAPAPATQTAFDPAGQHKDSQRDNQCGH